MNLKKQTPFMLAAIVVVGACAAGPSMAQGPRPNGPPPEMRAKFQRWQKWRQTHKNLSALQMTLRQVSRMDREPATQLTQPQATKMLSIVKHWQSKPSMSEAQAQGVVKQIDGILTKTQLAWMVAMQPRFGGGPGGRPEGLRAGGPPGRRPGGMGPGGMRPGGPPGMRPGGMRPGGRFQMPDPPSGAFNPLNANSLPTQQRGRALQNQAEFMAELQMRAKR